MRRQKTFSLRELHLAIEAGVRARGLDLPAPAIPTIKRWSAAGLIDNRMDLAQQADAAIDRMIERGERYYSPRKARHASKDAPSPAPSGKPTPPEFAHDIGAAIERAVERAVEQAITRLMPAQRASAAQPTTDAHGLAQDRTELLKAIGQLESVRQHVMRRFDAELTLIKQVQATASRSANVDQGAFSVNDMRLEGRLNRIEINQARMMELFEQIAQQLDKMPAQTPDQDRASR